MKNILTGAVLVLIVTSSVFLYCVFSVPCLLLKDGDTGRVLAKYPMSEGDEFSVTFIHSVNKSPVTDVYELRGSKIFVVRTIYYSFGAGVQSEVGEEQVLEYGDDGSMIVSGFERQMDSLSYIVGTVSDHTLYINNESISLRDLCGRNTTVHFECGRRLSV
ncbi:MAG: DUF1850 domain-containing protein [Clostridiaceae bacterium]|nr:DUF1850 domain-containing protein [Clostridiaceae bacterium]